MVCGNGNVVNQPQLEGGLPMGGECRCDWGTDRGVVEQGADQGPATAGVDPVCAQHMEGRWAEKNEGQGDKRFHSGQHVHKMDGVVKTFLFHYTKV